MSTKKRIISLLLSLVMVFSVIPASALTVFAAEQGVYNDLTYEIRFGEVTITDCADTAEGEIVIPDTIEGYPVTAIGEQAFAMCLNIEGVTIPETVTEIGDGAFYYCISLKEVNIPEGVTSIEDYTFMYCGFLESLQIPEGVTEIGLYAFLQCVSLKSINIPSSVNSIGNDAFSACFNLKDAYVFNADVDLSRSNIGFVNVYIAPEDYPEYVLLVKAVLTKAITNEDSSEERARMKELSVQYESEIVLDGFKLYGYADSTAQAYAEANGIEFRALEDVVENDILDYLTYEIVDGEVIITGCNELIYGDVVIPETIEGLPVVGIGDADGEGAFIGQYFIESVVLPGTVRTICDSAFSGCMSIESIIIPESVTHIGVYAFRYCENLKNVTIPSGVQVIDDETFYGCYTLESINIPATVNTIGDMAFTDCFSLTDIYINNPEASIHPSAFSKHSYILANGTMQGYVDAEVELIRMQYSGEYTEEELAAKEAEYEAIYGANEEWQRDDIVIYGYEGSTAQAYAEEYDFNFAVIEETDILDYLTYEIVDGEVIITGCNESFSGDVVIPDEIEGYPVTSIGDHVFGNCFEITSIFFPSSITHIGSGVLLEDVEGDRLTNLKSIVIEGSDITFDDGAFMFASGLESVTIGEGVKSLSKSIFGGSPRLRKVQLPESLTRIDDGAFTSCYLLSEINIPDSVEYIGDGAFWGCISLEHIELPANLKTIGYAAFSGCYSIENINIPSGVSVIPEEAFRWCFSLKNVIIPDTVTDIEAMAFEGCSSLGNIYIYNPFVNIADYAIPNVGVKYGDFTAEEYAALIIEFFEMQYSGEYTEEELAAKEEELYEIENSAVEVDFDVTIHGYEGSTAQAYAEEYDFNFAVIEGEIPEVDILNYISYEIDDLGNGVVGAVITDFDETYAGDVVIPDTIDGYPVVAIGEEAFAECLLIENVVLPDTVKYIGNHAFLVCVNLESIIIPEGVRHIDDYAFGGCVSLESIVLPSTIKYIGDAVFYECFSLTDIYAYCPGAEVYGELISKTGVRFKNGTWKDYADMYAELMLMYHSGNYTEEELNAKAEEMRAILGEDVEYVRDDITVYSYNPSYIGYIAKYTGLNFVALEGEADITAYLVYDIIDGEVTITRCYFSPADLVIPETIEGYPVTKIAGEAFAANMLVENVTIPATVTYIGERAFASCFSLESVDMSAATGIKEIAEGTFAGNYGFESVILPEGLESIGYEAFSYCLALKEINIPDTVTYIGQVAFGYCVLVEQLTIPESVEYVDETAFGSLYSLKDVYIMNPDTELGSHSLPRSSIVFSGYTLEECVVTQGDYLSEVYKAYFNGASDAEVDEIAARYENLLSEMAEHAQEVPSDVVIHGYMNSTAHDYAVDYDLFFAPFDAAACEHINVEFRNKVNVSCVSAGFSGDLYCADCGVKLADGKMRDAVGVHSFGEWEYTEASGCVTPGSKKRVCSLCGYTYKVTVSAPGHKDSDNDEICDVCGQSTVYIINLNETIEIVVNSGKTTLVKFVPEESGRYKFFSSDKTYLDSYCYLYDSDMNLLYECYSGGDYNNFAFEYDFVAGETYYFGCRAYTSETVMLPVTLTKVCNHNFSAVVTPPTCTQEGYTTYVCAECGYTYVDNYTSAQHVNSTENEYCTICGENAIDGILYYSITDGEVTITGCNYDVSTIVIPETIEGYPVTAIGSWAFEYKENLVSVTIPVSVTSIGRGVFNYCYNLESITVDADNEYYSSDEYGVLFNKDKTELVQYPIGNRRTTYTIPDNVISIEDYAFYNCNNLTSVIIPDSVETIGYWSFYDCYRLVSVTIGNSVETICDQAFYSCDSLASVTISDSVETIGSAAFCDCDSLTSVIIPHGVKKIKSDAFAACDILKTVIISDSVTSISDSAFRHCSSLESITVDADNEYYSSDEYGVLFNKDKTVLIQYPAGSSRTTYAIPDSVETICDSAFYNSDSLESVIIPDSVNTIGYMAFYDCDSLTNVTIPDSVKTIGSEAFYGCDNLTDVTIGNGVESIGSSAFRNCYSLESITVDADNEYYSSDEYGVLFNKDKTELIQYPVGNSRTTYTIPDSVETICGYAFRYCYNLTNVTIPDSVKTIDYEAFYDCDNLTEVTIGNGVETIDEEAFSSCDSLTSVTIPDSVKTIGNYAFSSCDSLTSVIIPDSVKTIGYEAFYCYNLESITILNAECEIYDSEDTIYSGATIYGYPCSTAQAYAEEYDREFVSLCEHEAEITVVSPTCTESGYTTYSCAECGYSYNGNFVNAAGHNDFNDDGICDVCDCRIYYFISAGETITVLVGGQKVTNIRFIPEVSGYYRFYSSADSDTYGYIYDEDMNILESNDDDGYDGNFLIEIYLNAGETYYLGCRYYSSSYVGSFDVTIEKVCSGHDYSAVVTLPTCTDSGYTTYVCSECGDYYTSDYVDATGHVDNNNDNICDNCGKTTLYVINAGERISVTVGRNQPALVKFVPETSDTYMLRSYAYGSDTFCTLYDADMNELASNDDYSNLDFGISYYMTAGETYYFGCRYLSEDNYGSFDVSLQVFNPDEPETGEDPVPDEPETEEDENIIIHNDITYQIIDGEAIVIGCNESISGEVVIPETIEGYPVTAIGECAFFGIMNISEVYISENIVNIGYGAFTYCYGLTGIYVDENNEYYSNDEYGVLFNQDKTELIKCPIAIDTEEYIIPDSVIIITSAAFEACGNVNNIYIPDSVTEIGSEAFRNCVGLEEIVIPDSVTYIGDCAFLYCYNVESVELGDNVNYIGYEAFGGCAISEIVIPASVETIEDEAFGYVLIEHSDELEKNESFVIYGFCETAAEAYANANGFTFVALDPVPDEPETEEETHYFGDWVIVYDSTCESTGLKKRVCSVCGAEETNEIPVKNHNYEMTKVIDATCRENMMFVYVCDTCGDSYTTYRDDTATALHADENSDNTCDVCSTSLICGENLTWIIDEDGTLIISGSGAMYDYTYPFSFPCEVAPWMADWQKISKVSVSEDVTTIGDYAFFWLSDTDEFEIPYGVTEIGEHSFDATGIVNVTIPDSVEVIGNCAFRDCYYLESITILNPECEIYDSEETIYEDATIYGYTGSTAEAYAEKYNRGFEPIDDGCVHDYVITQTIVTCTQSGYRTYTCSICNFSYTEIVPPTGHAGEHVVVPSTCAVQGVEYDICYTCFEMYNYNVLPFADHTWSDWTVLKEATVVQTGKRERTCTVCNYVYTEIIPRLPVDWENNENFGLVNFTIVDAKTGTPLSGAWISVVTENGETATYSANADGKVSIVLPVGEVIFAAGCSGRITRNLKYQIKHEEFDAPYIGLSSDMLIDAEITAKEMTYEEIIDAGIDVDAPENKHIVKYTVKFEYEAEERVITYYEDDDNNRYYGGGEYDRPDTPDGGYIIDDKTVYVTEKFYLIIHGQISWLKQMFNVEMKIYNNSSFDTFENVTATLMLPEGLSLAEMVDGEQSAIQHLGTVPELGETTCNWYVRGDEAGVYSISANLSGILMPYSEEFSYTYNTESPIKVYDENALRLYATAPEKVECGGEYDITIGIENISDITLYNVSHLITDMGQCVVRHYRDGRVVEEVYANESVYAGAFAKEFAPGDKLELTIRAEILFESEVYKDCIYRLTDIIIDAEGVKTDIENCFGVPAEHRFGDFVRVKDPTCITTGEEVAVCQNCDKEVKNIIPALGHDFAEEWTIDEEATCQTPGSMSRHCNRCDAKTDIEDIEQKPHTLEHVEIPSTCAVQGVAYDICLECYGTFNYTVLPFADHVWYDWSTEFEPTCEIEGFEIRICAVCGEEETNTLDALGHDFSTELTTDIEATCVTEGLMSYHCSRCDVTTGEVIIPAKGHNWSDWTTDSMPDCEIEGIEYRICYECDAVETNVLAALGHNFSDEWTIDKEATCQHSGLKSHHCSRCDAKTDITVIEQRPHTFEHYEVPSTCTVAGVEYDICLECFNMFNYTVLPLAEHTWGEWFTETDPTCIADGVAKRFCTVCGAEDTTAIPSLGHDFADEWTIDVDSTCTATGSMSRHCNRCDAKTDETEIPMKPHTTEHVVVASTCIVEGVEYDICLNCHTIFNYTVLPFAEHDWDAPVTEVYPTCTEAGLESITCKVCGEREETVLDALGHEFSDEWTIDKEETCTLTGSKSHHCIRCDEKTDITVIEQRPHTLEHCEVASTCTVQGVAYDFCLECFNMFNYVTLPLAPHTWSDWETIAAPDCEIEGLEQRICSVCEEEETNVLTALGHDFADEWTVDVESTCSTFGSESRHCSRCDAITDEREIPMKEHELEHIIVAATCVTTGMEYDACLVCFDEFNHVTLPLVDHTWSDWTTTDAPTCTAEGIETRTCTVCNKEETNILSALGHDFSDEWTVDIPATCITDGSQSHHCSRCEEKSDITVIPATGHKWSDWATTKAPTCTATGTEKRTCSACNEAETNTLAALGHDYETEYTVDKAATCTAVGSKSFHCTRCDAKTGSTTIPATGHKWSNWTTDKASTCTTTGRQKRTCSACNKTETKNVAALGHSYESAWTTDKAATCTTVGSKSHHCTRCDAKSSVTAIPATGHKWSSWTTSKVSTCTTTGLQTRTCSTCKTTENKNIAALGHDYAAEFTVDVAPTCTTTGSQSRHCSRCESMTEVTEIPMLEHAWSDWTTVTEPTCTTEGLEMRSCTACSKAEENVLAVVPHDYATIETLPTCTEQGYTTHTCSVCEDSYVTDYVDATGHSFGEWVLTTEPTYINEGVETMTCSTCSATETRTIEKLVATQEVVNEDSGISVSFKDDTYTEEIKVDVKPVYDGSSFQVINAQVGNFKATVYDITTYVNDEKVQPDGMVLIRMPIPEGYNPSSLVVYYLPSDGSAPEKMNSYVDGNFVCFETNHFSEYAIIDESEKTEENIVPEYILGDANGDGKVTASDARVVLRAAANLQPLEEKNVAAADVTKDGKITASDARKILRVGANLDTFDE